MKIRMLETRRGIANAVGSRTLLYRAGERYAMTEAWQRALAGVFIEAGWAVSEEPAPKRRRAAKTSAAKLR